MFREPKKGSWLRSIGYLQRLFDPWKKIETLFAWKNTSIRKKKKRESQKLETIEKSSVWNLLSFVRKEISLEILLPFFFSSVLDEKEHELLCYALNDKDPPTNVDPKSKAWIIGSSAHPRRIFYLNFFKFYFVLSFSFHNNQVECCKISKFLGKSLQQQNNHEQVYGALRSVSTDNFYI